MELSAEYPAGSTSSNDPHDDQPDHPEEEGKTGYENPHPEEAENADREGKASPADESNPPEKAKD